MTAHTPTHPVGSIRPEYAGRRAVLLALAVVLATILATIAVASAVSSVRDTPGYVPPAPLPTRQTVPDDLHPNRGWIVPRDGASAPTRSLPRPHSQYQGA